MLSDFGVRVLGFASNIIKLKMVVKSGFVDLIRWQSPQNSGSKGFSPAPLP